MKRRALLSTALGTTIVTFGCLGVGRGQDGEGTTVEIIPRNHTDQEVSLQVAVYAMDGSLLLDHTYVLPGGQGDESKGVENRVDHLVVSIDGGSKRRHEYAPNTINCSRDGEDVQILVESDGISFAYSC
ncbi:hypothetical protein [Halonotius roseus]|uniref:Uncharacterized protein n=1 Tax=Halonotius roseus TaxID=2511997 RepID=A0A544QMH6_9EURY|nr:hypothetical protein [Halonotius roseus]TQQ80112.1 hypothetical protein EWF95_06345 [Halonotius roseus]